MIVVDTSVWIDHLRAGDERLVQLLVAGQVLVHPYVVGELALGNLRNRDTVLTTLQEMPQAGVATESEVLRFIGEQALFGMGIGYVDAHLLASSRLSPAARLWTLDKRLQAAAHDMRLATFQPVQP